MQFALHERPDGQGPRRQADLAEAPATAWETCELTILMPCLNEAETLARCIAKARGFLIRSGIGGEVLIADNGSTDGSQQIAEAHGARVVAGRARRATAARCCGGIRAARGRYVIMGDADDSYDFSRLDGFVEKLRAGYELVMGNRFRGGIAPGAMPPLHRYLGNPVLSTHRPPVLPQPVRRLPLRPARLRPRAPSWRSTCRRRAWSSPARWW